MDYKGFKINCLNCHYMHKDNGNCTAVGGFCTSVPAAYCPLIPELISRAEKAEEENRIICGAMMHLHWMERPERLSVVYELNYDSRLSHKSVEDMARIIFNGLMNADLKMRGQKGE